MSLLWKKRRNHYSAGRGGLSHCWSWTKTLALFVSVMWNCSKSPVEVYVTLRTVSMFPAWRKWGPRTGKVTNHFPAFCFRPGPYHTVPVLGFFSPVFMWELLQDFTCWHHFSFPPHPLPYFDILRHLLQLIDSFASEIGELKEEMVQTSPTADKELMDSQGWDTSPSSLEVTLRLPDIPIQLLVVVILFYFFLVTVVPLD